MGSVSKEHKLPIIDLREENIVPGTDCWIKTCREVTGALEEYGCFVAAYDKVSSELHGSVFRSLEELFDLPAETKMQNKSTKPLYGYVGQIPFLPLYESMGIDYANTLQGIQSFTHIMWPNGNHSFSESLLAYSKLVAELEQVVVRMVFEDYDVGKYYEPCYLDAATYLNRVMKYRRPESSETNMGFVAHTDKSFMTVLHQNQVNGLEVQAKDGDWFDVDFSSSSFVVMAGDAIMAWSNNRIYSPQHRVTMKANHNSKESPRYSLGQFSFMKETVETPEELIGDEHPAQFKPFNHLEYLDFFNREENRRLPCAIKTFAGVQQ